MSQPTTHIDRGEKTRGQAKDAKTLLPKFKKDLLLTRKKRPNKEENVDFAVV